MLFLTLLFKAKRTVPSDCVLTMGGRSPEIGLAMAATCYQWCAAGGVHPGMRWDKSWSAADWPLRGGWSRRY